MIERFRGGLRASVMLVLVGLAMPGFAAQAASVADLLPAIGSGDENRRLDAIEALGRTRDPRALDPLLGILGNAGRPGLDRMAAAAALGSLGDRRAVGPLIEALRADMRERTGLLMAVIPSLGMLADARAVPILLEALNRREDHWLAREAAAEALGRIGDTRAVPHLINAAWMADTRANAVAALAAMADRRALEVLLSALQSDEEPEVRRSAAAGLTALGAAAVPPLADIALREGGEFDDPGMRLRAIGILGEIGGERARATLETVARDAEPGAKAAARAALGRWVGK